VGAIASISGSLVLFYTSCRNKRKALEVSTNVGFERINHANFNLTNHYFPVVSLKVSF